MKPNLHIEESGIDIFLHVDSMLWQVNSDSLGFVLYNQAEKKIYRWSVWDIENDDDIKAILNQELINFPFHLSIHILNYTPRYLSFPIDFSDQKYNVEFWELNMGILQGEKILEIISDDRKIYFNQGVKALVYDELNKRFPSNKWISIQSSQFNQPIYQTDKVCIRLIFLYKQIHISVYHNNVIYLVKAYPMGSPEDILWYLLNMISSFGFTNKDVLLYPEGFVDVKSSLFKLLDQYFERTSLSDSVQYQFPVSDFEVNNPTLIHIDRILSCVS